MCFPIFSNSLIWWHITRMFQWPTLLYNHHRRWCAVECSWAVWQRSLQQHRCCTSAWVRKGKKEGSVEGGNRKVDISPPSWPWSTYMGLLILEPAIPVSGPNRQQRLMAAEAFLVARQKLFPHLKETSRTWNSLVGFDFPQFSLTTLHWIEQKVLLWCIKTNSKNWVVTISL